MRANDPYQIVAIDYRDLTDEETQAGQTELSCDPAV